MTRATISIVCLLLPVNGQSSPGAAGAAQGRPIAIVDVTVLPMDGPARREHQTVLIEGATIRSLAPAGSVSIPAGALVVDGRGKVLLPGLTDAHVHLQDPQELPLFLSRGVTTVHDLNGSPETLDWRRRVAAGELVGPRIFATGPMLAGPGVPWRNQLMPTTPAQGRAAVLAQHAAGYDFIKVYDGLPADVYAAVLAAAHAQGMVVRGHIPQAVGLAGVLAAKQDVIEHAEKIVFAVWGHDFDTLSIPGMADSIRRAGTWVTPTLAVQQQLSLIGSGRWDSLMSRPEVALTPAATAAYWRTVSVRLRGNRAPPPGLRYNRFVDFQMQLTRGLARAGVPLLAGTDLPNAVMVPGYSLADELVSLVESGLSPLEALRSATVNPARLVGEGETVGTLGAGKRADLLLLDGDPLTDITNIRRVAGVVRDGRWYDAAALRVMVSGASEGYITTDDSVRLYYRTVGAGPETVVIPVGLYLEDLLTPLARPGRRLVFYDPRHRGRSGRGDLARVSLDRQVADLEQLRAALGIERMALIGWSGLGMEMAVYAIRHPDRVTRLVQVDAVPPAARIMRAAGGDRRDERMDRVAIVALDRRFEAGDFANDPAGFCRARNRLTVPSNFVDTTLASRVPDVCRYENEWPLHLWPYFDALLGSFGDYDWLDAMATLNVPRLVIHGREDGIPLAGARAWVAGFPSARLLVLSPAGHFPFIERPEAFFPAVDRFLSGEWPVGAERIPGP